MRIFIALAYGAGAAVVAILLHQSYPPLGVATSLLTIYFTIWLVGRRFGSRTYKWAAALGWLALTVRASTFGIGEELLVQGDSVGSTLLLLGTVTALAAVAARN